MLHCRWIAWVAHWWLPWMRWRCSSIGGHPSWNGGGSKFFQKSCAEVFGRGSKILFCGTEIGQSMDYSQVILSLRSYVEKVKPIIVEKSRKTMAEDALQEKEHRSLRALIGALAWPANQCLPQLNCTVSLLQASSSSPKVLDINNANKALRFAKEAVKSYCMTLRSHGECLANLRFGVYADAAWGVRPDGSSQGGFVMFVATEEEINSGKPMPLTLIDWHSRKLTRMCRSSLSAEAQAAAAAVDELEWIKVFATAMVNPFIAIEKEESLQMFGFSPMAIDAKSLYDAARSVSAGLRLSERRTAIEVSIVRERLAAMLGEWRWVNSEQQVADGLTKTAARDPMTVILSRGVHQLRFDPSFTAAKKVSKKAKERMILEHEEAAKEMFESRVFAAEEVKAKGTCALPGCEKEVEKVTGKEKFCSRRHFYLNAHRRGKPHDAWRTAAAYAVVHLLSEGVPFAEAASPADESSSDMKFMYTVLVVLFFAVVGMQNVFYKIFLFVNELVLNRNRENVLKNAQVPEENAAHVENEIPENDNAASHVDRENDIAPVYDIMSETSENTEEQISPAEWERWKRLKDEVESMSSERKWKEMKVKMQMRLTDPLLDISARMVILAEDWTEKRCMFYKKLMDVTDTSEFSDEQIKRFNKMWNSKLVFLVETNMKINETRKIRDAKSYLERLREKLLMGVVRDMTTQTRSHYDRNRSQPRIVFLRDSEHGAWGHHSEFYPHTDWSPISWSWLIESWFFVGRIFLWCLWRRSQHLRLFPPCDCI